jgi:AmmeMemoRadiSam system protein B/AmmeMemoRadiSam system protein A
MQLQDRKPAVADMFYEKDSDALKAHLDELFRQARPRLSNDEVQALIVPHAGYIYSGGVAASGFNQISEEAKYERVFLIGSSHRVDFDGASVYSSGDYITPLGKVEVDKGVVNKMIDSSHVISSDPSVHKDEHSLEVELPFLQHHLKHPFKLVPVIMGPHDIQGASDVAKVLAEWFKPGNLFVISTDFSHYPGYGDANEVDEYTAEAILKNDPEALLETLEENRRQKIEGLVTSLCGWSSVLMLLYLTQNQSDICFDKITYKNSGDAIIGDKNRVVGYHAIALFRKEKTKNEEVGFSLNADEKQWLLDRSHKTLDAIVKGNEPEEPDDLFAGNIEEPVGAFVSLYKDGKLRGCIGNFESDTPLWKVVDLVTESAAMEDPRFSPVTRQEVDELIVEISVLTPKRKIDNIDEIVPGKHGVFIRKNGRNGTFLPQVATKTGWNREELLGHCARDKAGLGWDGWKDADIFVYEALVFGDQ